MPNGQSLSNTLANALPKLPDPATLMNDWGFPLMAAAAGAVVGLIVHTTVYALLSRAARRTNVALDDAFLSRLRGVSRLAAVLLFVTAGLALYPFPDSAQAEARHVLLIFWIGVAAWVAVALSRVLEHWLRAKYDVTRADNLRARQIMTQFKVMQRIFFVVVVILALAAMLMTFAGVRALGASILASAGVAGIIIGFSAQKTIATLVAGVQIALTRPIVIDDVVIVEGEWGRIEEISYTYVVVRIWDQRRLILPITYFIDTPFQNWTRNSAEIMGTIFIRTDYAMDVEAMRAELTRICKKEENGLWDGRVCGLQVTDADGTTIQLRALVSSADASKNWDLRCKVREKLLAWLRDTHPEALPRTRFSRPDLPGVANPPEPPEPGNPDE